MKKITITGLAILLGVTNLVAQTNEVKYRRSSMTMVLIEDEDLGSYKDQVVNAYEANPFPDKYNEHTVDDKKFNVTEMSLTDEDLVMSGFLTDTLKTPVSIMKATSKMKTLRYITDDKSVAIVLPNKAEEIQARVDKYIREKGIGKQMVSTWFNRKEDGSMNWDLIKKRGLYSASAEDLEDSKTQADPTNFLFDFDLIGNSFVVFNKMNFYENEPVAAKVRDAAKAELVVSMAGKPQLIVDKANQQIDKVYDKMKEGYTVKCNTYLYQLNWDEDVATKYKNYFFNSNIDPVVAWDTTSLIKMNFVGKTISSSVVTFKLGETRTEEEIINLQIQRTMDNALTKLQKKYVVFRPVAAITGVNPVVARIGLKEGLEPGTNFEILESYKDELGLPKWKSIGKVSVDKKKEIWDNRKGAVAKLDENGVAIPTEEYTTFKGGAKAQPGMHFIRQVK
jgi:hypothetical protein